MQCSLWVSDHFACPSLPCGKLAAVVTACFHCGGAVSFGSPPSFCQLWILLISCTVTWHAEAAAVLEVFGFATLVFQMLVRSV